MAGTSSMVPISPGDGGRQVRLGYRCPGLTFCQLHLHTASLSGYSPASSPLQAGCHCYQSVAPRHSAHISVHHPLNSAQMTQPEWAICLLPAPDHRRTALLPPSPRIPEHPHSLVKDKLSGGSFHLQPLSTASDRQFPKHITFRMSEITLFSLQICSPTLFQEQHHFLPPPPRLPPCRLLAPGLHKSRTPACN